VSNRTDISVTGQCQGRALYIGANSELYVSRRYNIYRSDDWGTTWRLDCHVPASGWKPLAARVRLCARLLRYNIAALQVLRDGSRVAIARDGIYHAGVGETRMSRAFPITRGSRPLNLAVDGNRVLFGEYGDGYESSEVFLYVSEDGGRTFDVGYRFPKGDIRHVHNILVDPYDNHYWVLVGDFDRQPGIAALSKDLKTLEWLCRGSQECRAVGAIMEPDCLLYGTDSDREKNYIVRMDKKDGKRTRLLEVEGSSLYATTFGPIRVISTCVEPNPSCISRECSLYASRDGAVWKRTVVHKKDRYHPIYFQFGALALPYAYHAEARGMYSGQAVEQVDDKVRLIEWLS
jgi:hypothetical protein